MVRIKAINVPTRFVRKSAIFLVLVLSFFFSLRQVFAVPAVKMYGQRIQKAVDLKFKKISFDFLTPTYNFDLDKGFQKEVSEIKQDKILHDDKNDSWEFRIQDQSDLPLSVDVPDYFYEGSSLNKPVLQPFDPRFTLAMYLMWIKEKNPKEIPFHWSDWIDMSKLQKYILAKDKSEISCENLFLLKNSKLKDATNIRNIDLYCQNDKNSPFGFRIGDFSGAQSASNHEILGKSFLFGTAPSPTKVIFMTLDSGTYELFVQNKDKNDLGLSLLKNGIVEHIMLHKDTRSINVLEAYLNLLEHMPPPPPNDVFNSGKVHIPETFFEVNGELVIKELSEETDLDVSLKSYLDAIKYSLSEQNPPKFFHEANLPSTEAKKWLGDHYDWRFFNGITIGEESQMLALHRMIKAYLNFSRQNGLYTWIAHGSLLAWYWNGISFPWDSDVDVQMPIKSLHELGRRFNQSLIVENVASSDNTFHGLGRYFIDVGSSITHRTKGNGNNNIDARFIDLDTGLYVDITGLSISDLKTPDRYTYLIAMDPEKTRIVEDAKEDGNINYVVKNRQVQAYNCRNNHFSTYDELSPLVATTVENELAYIPNNFLMCLYNEYGEKGVVDRNHKDYIYLSNLRIWVVTSKILRYMEHHDSWLEDEKGEESEKSNESKAHKKRGISDSHLPLSKRVVSYYEQFHISQLSPEDYLNLLQETTILKDYFLTREFTLHHTKELKHLLSKNYDAAYEFIKNGLTSHLGKPLRGDPFLQKVYREGWNFNEEVGRIIDLQASLQDGDT